MMPPWRPWGNGNIQDGVQDGRQRDKVLNIFLSIWVRNIILVATPRFLRSRN